MSTGVPLLSLASRSPRRRALLDQIGIRYETIAVDVDESVRAGESAATFVRRLALAKARAGREAGAKYPVLGADTAVVIDHDILGKPVDRPHGLAMLERLSGRVHQVYTGVALLTGAGREHTTISVSRVRLRAIAEAERRDYWDTGEPRDKAGAYAIQGRGAVFVAELVGSYSGVMGLPLFETAALLNEAGVAMSGGYAGPE